MSTKKISIITVHYNDFDGLERTLKSVKEQSINKSYIEQIIVDGGTEKFDYFKVDLGLGVKTKIISESDKGVYDAMNKGISLAEGDFLIFLNAGDTFYSKETLLDLFPILNNKVELVYGDTEEVGVKGKRYVKKSRPFFLCFYTTPTRQQSMIFSRLVAKDMVFNLSYKIAADVDFVYRFIKKIKRKEIHRVSFPISTFYQGGLSYNNDELVAQELFSFREETVGMNKNFNYLLTFIHDSIRKLRRAF